MGERPDDKWAVPLCSLCHLDGPQAQHRIGEESFWTLHQIDPFALAAELYAEFKNGGVP